MYCFEMNSDGLMPKVARIRNSFCMPMKVIIFII